MFSTTTSILFIGRDRLVRCDFDARGRKVGCWMRARPVSAELPELIDAAARQASKRLGRTWILAEDFWTQRLSIDADMVAGLSPTEIARMLSFEAESLSGQTAIGSQLGYVRLDSSREKADFWVLQIPDWVRDQADSAVRQQGGRLKGLLHPGGLPTRIAGLSEGSDNSWGRIETWTGLTIAVGRNIDGRTLTSIGTGDVRTASGQRSLEEWLVGIDQETFVQHLRDSKQELTLSRSLVPVELDEEDTLATWLAGWAHYLTKPGVHVPLVVLPSQPISQGAKLAIAGTLALIVGGLGFLDRHYVQQEMTDLQKVVTDQKKLEQEQATLQKEIAELQKKIEAEKKRVALLQKEVPETEAAVKIYRRRWSELLGVLANSCPPDVVVQEITGKGRGLSVQGLSLGLKPLNLFTVDLGRKLAPLGWTIAPHYELNVQQLNRGELYSFSLTLLDQPLQFPVPSESEQEPKAKDNVVLTSQREDQR